MKNLNWKFVALTHSHDAYWERGRNSSYHWRYIRTKYMGHTSRVVIGNGIGVDTSVYYAASPKSAWRIFDDCGAPKIIKEVITR